MRKIFSNIENPFESKHIAYRSTVAKTQRAENSQKPRVEETTNATEISRNSIRKLITCYKKLEIMEGKIGIHFPNIDGF